MRIKKIAVDTSDDCHPQEPPLEKEKQKNQELLAKASETDNLYDGAWSQSYFGKFDGAASSVPSVPVETDEREGEEVEQEGTDRDEENVQEEAEAEEHHLRAHGEQGSAAEVQQSSVDADKLLTLADVRGAQYGYGPDGKSVQGQLHAKDLHDRVIMKRTLLTGTPTISSKQPCEKMKSSRAGGQKATYLPKEVWWRVMEAGLEGCAIAKWNKESKEVLLARPPVGGDERVKYHNELMKLCGLSLPELVNAMTAAKKAVESKAEKQQAKGKAQPARAENRSRSRSRSRR